MEGLKRLVSFGSIIDEGEVLERILECQVADADGILKDWDLQDSSQCL
jgi:hypothetical protein